MSPSDRFAIRDWGLGPQEWAWLTGVGLVHRSRLGPQEWAWPRETLQWNLGLVIAQNAVLLGCSFDLSMFAGGEALEKGIDPVF